MFTRAISSIGGFLVFLMIVYLAVWAVAEPSSLAAGEERARSPWAALREIAERLP